MPGKDPPPLIDFADPTSFASFTLRERMPRIVENVAALPGWSAVVVEGLTALAKSLPLGRVPHVVAGEGPDRAYWDEHLGARVGRPWGEMGFLEAEFVFYRTLFEIVRMGPGEPRDPYAEQKMRDLERAAAVASPLARDVAQVRTWNLAHLSAAVSAALFGNSSDLSQLASSASGAAGRAPLANDLPAVFEAVVEALLDDGETTVDVVLDNAGEELVTDLALVGFLLGALPKLRVRLHAKPFPMFVSDATSADVQRALERLAADATSEVSAWGRALRAHADTHRLSIAADDFWGRPDDFAAMPPSLREQLRGSALLILKGDLNYRRYVGDRHWPPSSPISAHRIPTLPPALAIRILKSDVAVGLDADTVARLTRDDPPWLHAGRYGVIQYFR